MSANQPAGTDPTKMGVGRSIAVLTSGGDAQGEPPGWFLVFDGRLNCRKLGQRPLR